RADQLAGGGLAVHAGDRLEVRAGLCGVAGVVAVDADPVHLAPGDDLHLADDRDVVLGLAGDRASGAADAGVQVDRHAPGVAVVGVLGVERGLRARLQPVERAEEVRVGAELLDRPALDDVATLHAGVVLRAGERIG